MHIMGLGGEVFKNFPVPFFFETASKVGLDFMLQEFLASESQNKAQKRNIVAGIRLNTTKGPNCMQESGSQIKKQESRSRSSPPPNNLLNVRPCVALLYYFKTIRLVKSTIDVPSQGWIYWGYRGCLRGANYT